MKNIRNSVASAPFVAQLLILNFFIMKVKDFINYLSSLDPEKCIWIVYDHGYGYVLAPNCVEVYDGSFNSSDANRFLTPGDYIFDIS